MIPPKSTLPESTFSFSQGSLQAYVDCPRLFQLRYLERLLWPAPEIEPALENERYLTLGTMFHQMVQQFQLGVPAERLAAIAQQDTLLTKWWQNYTVHRPILDGYKQTCEHSLSTPIGDHRLTAKYDFIAVNSKTLIYDWKTSRKQAKREWMETKLQTRVYPYLLVRAGAHLNAGSPIDAGQIEMVYWFSSYPTAPMVFPYSQDRYQADDQYLHSLIAEIQAMETAVFPLTDNFKRCRFCVYRSLCDRGEGAGTLDELEDDLTVEDELNFDFDFDQIAEIEF
jgi:CRISPR/Cas system-associated exonuclease Cas4 (RecB family)